MGVVACLATVQPVTFAGVMTLIEVGGLGFGRRAACRTSLPNCAILN